MRAESMSGGRKGVAVSVAWIARSSEALTLTAVAGAIIALIPPGGAFLPLLSVGAVIAGWSSAWSP
jgi:hypothetical protein